MGTTEQPTHAVNGASSGSGQRLEVAVIGGGQAGLAIGHFLARAGRRFLILEAGESVATAWRHRWDSLILFTSRRYDGLPGLPFPGDADGYPGRDEVVAYLEQYARTFDLPVRCRSCVRSLTANDHRGFVLELDDASRVEADQVVVATGPFHVPNMPALADELDPALFQAHSAAYRSPSRVPDGTVLVVGGGNTGFQIAKELSATHTVHLAAASRRPPLPQRLLGRDLFWWLTRLGLLDKSVDSRLGRRAHAQGRDTLIGSRPRPLGGAFGVALPARAVGGGARSESPSGRGRSAARGGRCASPTARRSTSTPSSGRPGTGPTTLGSISPSPTGTAGCATGAVSATSAACTSSGSPGSTRADRRCSASSRTTPSSSPGASKPLPPARRRPSPTHRTPKAP